MVKQDFPLIARKINGKSIVYLDNSATTQKPRAVIDAVSEFYEKQNANINRGIYKLSEQATDAYESARKITAKFINAHSDEIVFTSGTTDGINMFSYAWARRHIKKGDVIAISILEHHSNFLPWQRLCQSKKAVLKVLPICHLGRIKLEGLKDAKIRLVSIAHVSNVLGTLTDVSKVRSLMPKKALLMVDSAQSFGHVPIDVKKIGCDVLVASAHKAYGPMGVGVMYVAKHLHDNLEPYQVGGGMIERFSKTKNKWLEMPYLLSAGTPNVAGAVGFGKALEYILGLGIKNIHCNETKLVGTLLEKLKKDNDITVYGPPEERVGAVSFNVKGVHPHDLAQICDYDNVYIRAGHHCAQPLHNVLGVLATARASFGIYNDEEDIERLMAGIAKAKKIFSL